MYVTLEPCAHQGRQPPCTEAILEAGIARVVIASDDPSEKAAGRGPGILRDGGVEVEFAAGEEAAAARLLNQPFRKHARTGRPLVTLKMAMSLDGRVATPPGRLPVDLRRAAAASWSTAGAPSRDAIAVGHRHRPRRRPAAHRAPRPAGAKEQRRSPADPGRLRLPRPPAARLAAAAHPRPVAGDRRRLSGGRRLAPCARPGPRSSSPTASAPRSPTSAGATSPASSSRAARGSPPRSSTRARSTRLASSSLRSCSAAVRLRALGRGRLVTEARESRSSRSRPSARTS